MLASRNTRSANAWIFVDCLGTECGAAKIRFAKHTILHKPEEAKVGAISRRLTAGDREGLRDVEPSLQSAEQHNAVDHRRGAAGRHPPRPLRLQQSQSASGGCH